MRLLEFYKINIFSERQVKLNIALEYISFHVQKFFKHQISVLRLDLSQLNENKI